MELKNKCELVLKDYDKCALLCDADCPLGQLYDYSCDLQAFIMGKMKQAEEAKNANAPAEVPQE